MATIKRWKKVQTADRLLWGEIWNDTGYVFTNESGLPYHPNHITKMFDAAVKQSEQPRIRLHDLRHTFATIALTAGVHPKVVSERLGHASIGITLDIYSHVMPGMQEEAAARVGNLIFG